MTDYFFLAYSKASGVTAASCPVLCLFLFQGIMVPRTQAPWFRFKPYIFNSSPPVWVSLCCLSLFPYCSRQFHVSGAVVDVCGCAHTYSPSTRMAERGGANRACWSISLVEYTNSGPMRNCVSETRRATGQDTHPYPNTSTQGNRIHLSVVSLGVQETWPPCLSPSPHSNLI